MPSLSKENQALARPGGRRSTSTSASSPGDDGAALLAQAGGEQVLVGVDDPAWFRRLAQFHQFVAGGKERHSGSGAGEKRLQTFRSPGQNDVVSGSPFQQGADQSFVDKGLILKSLDRFPQLFGGGVSPEIALPTEADLGVEVDDEKD